MTGNLLEADYLYPAGDPRVQAINSINFKSVEYRKLAQAILECVNGKTPNGYHGDELWEPPTQWMNDVHYAIVSALELTDWRKLSIIPTLKTSADIHHGIDFMVVFEEPETERSVIVTVDLSLRKKKKFGADLLITDTGAMPNEDYFFIEGVDIPDEDYGTAEDDDKISDKRKKEIGTVIATMIREKLDKEDPHYGQMIQRNNAAIRNGIRSLMIEQT